MSIATENNVASASKSRLDAIIAASPEALAESSVTVSDDSAEFIIGQVDSLSEMVGETITLGGKLSELYVKCARVLMEIRSRIILPNGHPDWAGATKHYKALVTDTLNSGVFATSPASKGTVMRGIQNQMVNVRDDYILGYVFETHENLSEDASYTKEGTPKKALKDAVAAEFNAQGTIGQGGNKRPRLTVPAVFGGPSKEDAPDSANTAGVNADGPKSVTTSMDEVLGGFANGSGLSASPFLSAEFLVTLTVQVLTWSLAQGTGAFDRKPETVALLQDVSSAALIAAKNLDGAELTKADEKNKTRLLAPATEENDDDDDATGDDKPEA